MMFEADLIELAIQIQEDRSNEIHVTDLTGCIRASYFRKKYGIRFNLVNAISILLGQTIHDYVLPFLASKYNGEYEVKFEHYGVKGSADLVIGDTVYELKTVNNIPKEPYKSHVEQCNFYIYALDKKYGAIVYISRTQFEVKVFDVIPNYDMYLETLEKARILEKALIERKPPKCNLSLSEQKFYCKYCNYRDLCAEED